MIQRKLKINKNPANFATARLNLQRELDLARQKSDAEKIDQYTRELADLTEQQQMVRPDSTKTDAFFELNKRNRSINVKEGQEAGGRKRVETVESTGVDEVTEEGGGEEVKLLDEALLMDDDWLDDIDMSVYAC